MANKNATLETAHRALALQAQPIAPGLKSIPEALKELGMSDAAYSYFADTMTKLGTAVSPMDLTQWGVPMEVVAQFKAGKAFAEKGIIGKVFDAANNIFKTYVTQLFPSYHTANIMGGITQNLMTGTYDPTAQGLAKLWQPYVDAAAALRRKPIKGIEQFAERFGLPMGSSSAQVTDAMLSEMMSRGVLSPQSFLSAETVGPMGRSIVQAPMVPGQKGFFTGTAPVTWKNPLATRGVWSEETAGAKFLDRIGESGHTEFAPVRGAEIVSSITDSWNRAAHFIAKIKQGLTPDQATASTLAAHFDYRNLSPFEKSWIRSMVPFYNWQRGNMVLMANLLASNPGKINAMMNASQMGNEQGYVPPNLRGNLNIGLEQSEYIHPESGRKELRQTFVQPLPQLPFEEAMKWLTLKPNEGLSRLGALSGIEEKLGGATTPILLRPLLERLRGQSYLTDQRVDMRRLMPDMTPLAESAIDNLPPLGRLAAMLRSAEREGQADRPRAEILSTILGGPRFRTVDLIGAREREARDVLRGRLGESANLPLELRMPLVQRAEHGDPSAQDDIIRMRALRTLEGLQKERSMAQRLEQLYQPPTTLESYLSPSRAGMEPFAPLWRNQMQQEVARRQWRDYGLGGRNPYSSVLGRDRRDILSSLRGY